MSLCKQDHAAPENGQIWANTRRWKTENCAFLTRHIPLSPVSFTLIARLDIDDMSGFFWNDYDASNKCELVFVFFPEFQVRCPVLPSIYIVPNKIRPSQ